MLPQQLKYVLVKENKNKWNLNGNSINNDSNNKNGLWINKIF